MSLAAQIIDQRVSGIAEKHADFFADELRLGNDEERKKSTAFLLLVTKTIFDLPDDEAKDSIVDGGNDFGLDVLYFEPPADEEIAIAVVQGKYRRKLDGAAAFPENGIEKLIAAIGALFDPARQVASLGLNERLEQRVEQVRAFVRDGAIPRVTAVAANNGVSWTEHAEQRIGAASRRFGNQVEWHHFGCDELLAELQARKPVDDVLNLAGEAVVETFDFRRVLVGRISATELARLVDNHDSRLFEKNIRRYLGLKGNRVNESIAATLRDPFERPNFYFYNNGITMVCSQFRHNALSSADWRVQVKDMQIVNGGQTARTIQQIALQVGAAIDLADVLVRIYEVEQDDDALVEAITFATNSQNPVDLRDLKANDSIQQALAASIESLGYEYRAKREDAAVSSNEFTSATVAEAVLAVWRARPHQARFARREHFGALYETIFTRDLNGAQAVIAALLHRHAENRRRRPPEGAPDFLAYGSRFVAMLMGRYLLHDMGDKGVALDRIDHRNFEAARRLVEERHSSYMERAEQEIADALDCLFGQRERTLQRLSATFRRGDLVEMLTGSDV